MPELLAMSHSRGLMPLGFRAKDWTIVGLSVAGVTVLIALVLLWAFVSAVVGK
jgi:hypothetical protein